MFFSSISSLTPVTFISGVTQALNNHSDKLQAALNKYWEDILHLLRMGPTFGKPTLPPKMHHKIRAANMKTMTKANSLIGCTGGRELSTRKLKEDGRIAEHKAMECYKSKVGAWNAMDYEPPPNINSNININALDLTPSSSLPWMSHRVLMSFGNQCSPMNGIF
jgi:hypothetical protein